MDKMRSCTIRCPEADPVWDMLEAKRKETGLETLEEVALRLIRTSLGLPAEYAVFDARDIELPPKKPRLHVVK